MKIIQVQTQAEAAGAQRISDMVGEGLRRRGHDVRTVFMYRKTAAYDDDPFADFIVRSRPGAVGKVRAVLGLCSHLMREKPDAVIGYQHFGSVCATIGGRLAGARRIVANQSGVPLRGGLRGFATFLDRLFGQFGAYQYSIVNSAWTAAQFARYPAAYRKRLRMIVHGVEAPAGGYDRAWARSAFGLPAQAPLLVTSGRLSVLKNHAILLDVLAAEPDWHLAVAGEGPERARLLARANALGVADRLHLVGEVARGRIHQFLAAGDVYVFPSLQETFGLAVVEAALAGLPVVATNLPVLEEVLTTADGVPAALFVPGTDAGGFRDAVRTILADPAVGARLTSAGRRLAEAYAPERMVAAYEALLV